VNLGDDREIHRQENYPMPALTHVHWSNKWGERLLQIFVHWPSGICSAVWGTLKLARSDGRPSPPAGYLSVASGEVYQALEERDHGALELVANCECYSQMSTYSNRPIRDSRERLSPSYTSICMEAHKDREAFSPSPCRSSSWSLSAWARPWWGAVRIVFIDVLSIEKGFRIRSQQ
jgi:hypothetical protein